MKKILSGLILWAALAFPVSAQFTPPAGAQVTFPVDNFPLAGPSGGFGLQSCTSSCLNTTILGPADTTGFGGISVQVTSIGGGATLSFQGSNDQTCSSATNWVAQPGGNEAAQTNGSGFVSGGITTVTNVTGTNFAATFHCFRVQITAYTSGTISAQGYLRIAAAHVFVQGGLTPLNAILPPYPGQFNGNSTGVPITASATGTTASIAITLAAVASKTTYLCGYTLAADATAATEGAATITGTITGTMNFRQSVANLTNGTALTQQTFTPCIPASATNTAITINSVAAGSGGNAAGYAWGFQL